MRASTNLIAVHSPFVMWLVFSGLARPRSTELDQGIERAISDARNLRLALNPKNGKGTTQDCFGWKERLPSDQQRACEVHTRDLADRSSRTAELSSSIVLERHQGR